MDDANKSIESLSGYVPEVTRCYKDILSMLEPMSLEDQMDLINMLNKRVVKLVKAKGTDREIHQLFDSLEDMLDQASKRQG